MRARSTLSLLLLSLVALFLMSRPVAAFSTVAPPSSSGTEWVLILDNSASMSGGLKLTTNGVTTSIPATDPDRLSVVATLIFRAMLDKADHLTILTFDSSGKGRYRELPAQPDAIRALSFDQSTPFTGPLRRAREILTTSTLPARVLLLVTDGGPSEDDMLDAAQARALLGVDRGTPSFAVHSLGLTGGNAAIASIQRDFLGPLGELLRIDSAQELVKSFTKVFAAQIHSRPESGELASGGAFSFPVGRYVTSVLVNMASSGSSGPFEAQLLADGKPVPTTGESGDNHCATPPCHTYQVMKAEHDPELAQRFTLLLARASGPVAYGVILRYDLAAELVQVPASAQVGEEIEVRARILWHGETFRDPAFFQADGFAATIELNGVTQPLQLRADGTFGGRVKATTAGPQPLRAHFVNHWLSLAAAAELQVKDWLPLVLSARPDPLDFGSWRGEREGSQRCAELDLSGSRNANRVPLEVIASGLPDGVTLVTPAPLKLDGDRASVCLQVRGCCGDLQALTGARLSVRGRDPHYHPAAIAVGIAFAVKHTPWWTCWWRTIVAVGVSLWLAFVIWGFVRPYDFDTDATIHLAKNEAALARGSGRRLRDLPGGRRGFYRDARVRFDSSGNAASSHRGAILILRAAGGEPLITAHTTIEQKSPRTRKWEALPVPIEPGTIRRGVAYRSGDFYFRLG